MPIDERRKTSFEVDFAKVARVKMLLNTTGLTDTIDAALDEILHLEQRRRLVELLFDEDSLDLDSPDIMSGAWR